MTERRSGPMTHTSKDAVAAVPDGWTMTPQRFSADAVGEPLEWQRDGGAGRTTHAAAMTASLLLHLFFLSGLLREWELPTAPPPARRVIEISLVDLPLDPVPTPPPPKRQIVTPSAAPKAPPPPETTRLSDTDTAARIEQVRRGDGGRPVEEAPPPPQPAVPQPKPVERDATQPEKRPPDSRRAPLRNPDSPPERASKSSPRRGPLLKLDDEIIASRFGKAPGPSADHPARLASASPGQEPQRTPGDRERLNRFHRREPFSQAEPFALFSGRGGTPDYLPNVQDGDVTLLNAKADRHAVFVRRVALQVFGSLRRQSWREIPYGEVSRIREFARVRARMALNGKLVDVEILESSGSETFDRLVSAAAQESCWDQNPPREAAAADGTIQFVFEARTWARGRESGPREQRWLLLGTGLL